MDQETGASFVAGTIFELPSHVLEAIFVWLPPRDLASCIATCSTWNKPGSQDRLWRRHCLQRWKVWTASSRWLELKQQEGGWKLIYKERYRVDQTAKALLSDLVWPGKRHAALRQLQLLGGDVLDLLDEVTSLEGTEHLGSRYWGAQALLRVLAQICAQQMKRLASAPEPLTQLERGALLLVQLHYPKLDIDFASAFLDQLAAELRRRMATAGVTGGLEGVKLLNQLLFGPRAPSVAGDGPSGTALSQLQVPADGYGLGLQGDQHDYYSPHNSLLTDVLLRRRGIPITLGVLHCAVGRRAGLPIEPVNMPMHFMTKLGAENDPDERFIDVFEGGKLLTREEMPEMFARLLRPYDPTALQPASAADVYVRMCANLVSIYRDEDDLQLMLAMLDLLLAAGLPLASQELYLFLRAKVELQLMDCEAALQDLQRLQANPQREDATATTIKLQEDMQADWQAVFQRTTAVQHNVGDVIKHRRYNYRGIIVGIDTHCCMPDEWIQQMSVDSLPHGRHQPFYSVLVDQRDRPSQTTYVAAENVQVLQRNADSEEQFLVENPEVGAYFNGISKEDSRYVANAYYQFRFPVVEGAQG